MVFRLQRGMGTSGFFFVLAIFLCLATTLFSYHLSQSLTFLVGGVLGVIVLLTVHMRLRTEKTLLLREQARTAAYAREVESLYNDAPCGYHSIDQDALVIRMNDTELKWFGYERHEVVNRMYLWELMTPEAAHAMRYDHYPAFLKNRGVSNVDIEFQRRDGSTFVGMVNATLHDQPGGGTLTHSVLTDVSHRKRAAQQIEYLNVALQRRAAEADAANAELESFAYSVSHDLRAPLRIIDGYALMLEEDSGAQLDDEGRQRLAVIRRNVGKMDTLIVAMLSLALPRSVTGEIALEPVDMQSLAAQVVGQVRDAYRPAPGAAVPEIAVDSLDDAAGNRPLLAQVWTNLLQNAIKYSAGKSHPAIRITSTLTEHEVTYCITDNGIGFDMRYADKLFGAFQRLHARDEFEGTGIGLALVKRIVTRHGGIVRAEGVVNEGARFYFSLPRMDAPAKESQ